jgi:hypothetical protein
MDEGARAAGDLLFSRVRSGRRSHELRNQSCECLPPSGCICRLDKQNGPEAGAILREAVPTALPWVAHPRDRCGFVDAVGTQETEVGKETIGQWRRLTVAAADPLRWSLALI